MRRALADAGLTPGRRRRRLRRRRRDPRRSTRWRPQAIHEVFGDRDGSVPVTAPQGFVGRLCAGGAALNVATALLAMRDGIVPAVGNLTSRCPGTGWTSCGEPRALRADVVLVNARGHGGFNSCHRAQAFIERRAA